MAVLIDVMHVFTVLNLLLLISLGYVWGRNFLQFRSKHTLGLLVFAVLLGLENALGIYFFVFDPVLSTWINAAKLVPPIAQWAMLALRVFEFGGIAFLSWVTWD